jgi:hypothetical protein
MAGSGVSLGFDSTAFRNAILLAMGIAAPSDVSQQVTFIIPETATFSPEDPGDNPYDWTATPVTDVAERSVVVLAAVTFGSTGVVDGTSLGAFDPTKITLTLLDTQQILVVGATSVLVGGTSYSIDPPGAVPEGLFDVTIYTYHLTAIG